MNVNNEKGHATKISQQLHKNLVFQRGPDTIQQVGTVPARGYVTYSSRDIIDHRGDGQWQTQRRYGSSTEETMPRDYFGPYHNQANYRSNDYRSDDPVFDEFLSSLMASFEGYNNPNIIGYRTEFAPPVGYYDDPNFTNMKSNHSAQFRDKLSRPGPRMSAGRYPEQQYAQPRFGPLDPTRHTQFNYTDSSVRMNDGHPRTQRSDVPGKQPSEFFPWQNLQYSDHQYAPHDPTNRTQLPNIPPQRNSSHPILSNQFDDGKPSNAGAHGYSPSGEFDYVRNSPKEGYNYSYAPPAPMAPRDSITHPEVEPSWDAKGNTKSNTGEKISNMATGALNFAKKNMYPPPDMANRWQFNNQPKLGEKSSNSGSLDLANTRQYTVPVTQEEGNTRPEFSRISSQGKGTAFPTMAKNWIGKQLNTGEKNPHNETSDFPQPTQFPTPASQQNGYTHPEFSRSASQGKGNARLEMAKSWFSKQPNTGEKNPHNEISDFPQPTQFPTPASQENRNTRTEFSKSASRGKGNAFPEMAKSLFSKQSNTGERNPQDETLDLPNPNQSPTPAWQEEGNTIPEFSRSASKGNARPEIENRWEIVNQPNNGETYSTGLIRDSSRRNQVMPDSQEKGNGSLEASNGSEINKQPKITEKFSKFGALNRKSQFPALFSKDKGNDRT